MVNNNLKNTTYSAIAKSFLLAFLCFGCLTTHAQAKKDKAAETDTFKIANRLIAKRKYGKANKILSCYHKNHPGDVNSIWLQAQAKLYSNNFRQSDKLYKGALKIQPDNDYVQLSYIHSLLDMGKNETAGNMLNSMEQSGKSYSDMSFLYAQLYFWEGNYLQSSAYLKKALQQDGGKKEFNDLYDQLEYSRSPKASISTSYLTDNQPLTAVISSLKFENYFSRFADLYISCDEYHFLQDKVSDAPWVSVGDKLFFPKIGLQINAALGYFQFPVIPLSGASGHLSITKKITRQFDLEVVADHGPYLDTRASIDTNVKVSKLAGMLNWHRRSWKGQAAYLTSLFDNNKYVYSAYAWVMAPIVTFPSGQLQIGYSTSYSTSNVNSYTAVNSLRDILANYTPNQSIAGIYTPYFTPNDLIVNSALLSFNINLSKKVNLALNGDIGYGSINNPYLFLDKNSAGTVFINKGYSIEHFTPADASIAINYHIDKTWLLQAKYVYRSTYFFTSNYGSLSLEKSFQGKRKEHAHTGKSAFMDKIQDIQDRIHALYACTNPAELKLSVNKIKGEVTVLRDEQKMLRNTSEILPNSDKALLLQDRYDGLNDMLNELNSISLDDAKDSGNKSEWLVDKLYELTAISYNSDFQE
jgi:hypothetical protein